MGVLSSVLLRGAAAVLEGLVDTRSLTMPRLQLLARQGKVDATVAASLPRVLIVGEGGAGKSTLLKQMLVMAAARGNVPVWVSLAELPADGPLTTATLVNHLVIDARSKLGVGDVNPEFFQALITDGRLTIGFDALDECPSLPRRQRARSLLGEVASEWSQCQVFATSRPEALRDTPLRLAKSWPPEADQFIALTPRPFGQEDVVPFLRVAFENGETIGDDLLARTDIDALIATPLTLTLIGLVAQTPRGLPVTRTPLFARCLDTVCETWESAKGPQPPPDGLDPRRRLDVLRRLGWVAQVKGGEDLDADDARAAIESVPDRDISSRAEEVLAGLARRNLLLRAETADDGSLDLIRLHFSHAQFREYLAGAHLMAQFVQDPAAAQSAMEPYWLDARWLEVLRFAVASAEERPARRDALLRTILAAKDRYQDLLHRPVFLVAELLARLTQADPAIVGNVASVLEQVACAEPALRDAAAEALLGLRNHRPAQPAIERFARGESAALAFPLEASDSESEAGEIAFDSATSRTGRARRRQRRRAAALDPETRLDSLQWRLSAIEAYAAAGGRAGALEILGRLPSVGLDGDLAACEVRLRLGDAKGAEGTLRALFDGTDDNGRYRVAEAMEAMGEGRKLDDWLGTAMKSPNATVSLARLAIKRGVIDADHRVWTLFLARGRDALAQLPAEENFAPQAVSDVVYALMELVPSATWRPAARALLKAALHHRSMMWFVATRITRVAPELAAEAAGCLKDYVLEAWRSPTGILDRSRINGSVGALCGNDFDDKVAVPALLELFRQFPLGSWHGFIAQSLKARGEQEAVFKILRPLLSLPAESGAGAEQTVRDRREAWAIAETLDREHTHTLLDTLYRAGNPERDAESLMAGWNESGVATVAREWIRSIGNDPANERAQRFLKALTSHEHKANLTDYALRALEGGDFAVETVPPWTARDYLTAFEQGLETGHFVDWRSRLTEANGYKLAGLLARVSETDNAQALAAADRWVQREIGYGADQEHLAALAECLDALSDTGLQDPLWCDAVADIARACAPGDRAGLVSWLRTNV
jgi:hypothetical protein